MNPGNRVRVVEVSTTQLVGTLSVGNDNSNWNAKIHMLHMITNSKGEVVEDGRIGVDANES
jgi:hypothetical protein